MSYRELLGGCGLSREKRIVFDQVPKEWRNVTRLDIDPSSGADVIHDLNILPYPFEDETFDECHFYECLEHVGSQGDWKFFFSQFAEFYRILKPNGWFCGTVPMWNSPWAFGDPSHTRVIPKEMFSFLSQEHYDQCGTTPCSDFRPYWKGNFITKALVESKHTLKFVLQKN
jgi:SAM-dependent methyltransferase